MFYFFFFIGCVESIIPLESIELGNCGKMTIDFETYKAPNKNTKQNDYDKVQVIKHIYEQLSKKVYKD